MKDARWSQEAAARLQTKTEAAREQLRSLIDDLQALMQWGKLLN